jgi:hypothetical protein
MHSPHQSLGVLAGKRYRWILALVFAGAVLLTFTYPGSPFF